MNTSKPVKKQDAHPWIRNCKHSLTISLYSYIDIAKKHFEDYPEKGLSTEDSVEKWLEETFQDALETALYDTFA